MVREEACRRDGIRMFSYPWENPRVEIFGTFLEREKFSKENYKKFCVSLVQKNVFCNIFQNGVHISHKIFLHNSFHTNIRIYFHSEEKIGQKNF